MAVCTSKLPNFRTETTDETIDQQFQRVESKNFKQQQKSPLGCPVPSHEQAYHPIPHPDGGNGALLALTDQGYPASDQRQSKLVKPMDGTCPKTAQLIQYEIPHQLQHVSRMWTWGVQMAQYPPPLPLPWGRRKMPSISPGYELTPVSSEQRYGCCLCRPHFHLGLFKHATRRKGFRRFTR